jgi:DNA-binding CsgD family transcriptional regulator
VGQSNAAALSSGTIRRPHGGLGRLQALVERAACPAVATGPDNRILAWNRAFAELSGREQLARLNLQDLLRCRHVNGNLMSRGHVALHEMVLAGEAPAAFEVDLEPPRRPRTRAEVSVVVVLDRGEADHRLIYMLRPRHRRRRVDAALEQLLSGGAVSPHPGPADRSTSPLTRRQCEVLRLMARGASAAEIAEELGITHNTVRSHIRAIFHALGVTRQTEAVALALRDGFA